MKNFNLIYILILIPVLFYGQRKQEYRPLEIEDLHPVWYETCFDSLAVEQGDRSVDGYRQFYNYHSIDPIIHDGKIFSGYTLPYGGIDGGYIDCRNLASGHLIWRVRLGLLVQDHVEFPRVFEIIDNALWVFCQMLREPGIPTGHHFNENVLTIRKYDLNTGELLDYVYSDVNDDEVYSSNHRIGGARTRGGSFLFPEGDNVRIIENFFRNPDVFVEGTYMSTLLDKEGKVLTRDSVISIIQHYNVWPIHKDTFLSVEFDQFGMIFKYLSPRMKVLDSLRVQYDFDHLVVWFEVREIDIEKRKILLMNRRNGSSTLPYYEVYVFNFDGTLVSQHSFEDEFSGVNTPLRWKDGEVIFIENVVERLSTHVNSSIHIFTKIGKEPRKTIKRFEVTNNTAIRYIPYVQEIDTKLLLHLFEIDYVYDPRSNIFQRDGFATAWSLMLVDMEELGITSSTKEDSWTQAPIIIYPNPTATEFTIDGVDKGEVSILDISGKEHMRLSYYGGEPISIAHLEAGLYLIKIETESGSRIRKVIKGY